MPIRDVHTTCELNKVMFDKAVPLFRIRNTYLLTTITLIMPKKLTVAEQAIAAKASQDLYQYEKICEEHSAVLRRDSEGCLKAHQEYTANANPMGFMPPRDEFDCYIEESEKVLKKDCRTVLEYAVCQFNGVVVVLIYCFP